MKITFGRLVLAYGIVVATLLAIAIVVYYWLESRPVDVQPIAVYEAPREIFERAHERQNVQGRSPYASSVYMARTFEEAGAILDSSVGLESYDGQSLLRASSRACEGYDESLRPEDWRRSLLYPAVEGQGHAMRSLQMVVYFQSEYCPGVPPSSEFSSVEDFLGQVDALAASTRDQDTLDLILLMSPIWERESSGESELDLNGFGSLAARTASPAIFSEALGVLMSRDPEAWSASRHVAVLSGEQEIRHARSVAISLARCEIFDACPPMGLALMAQCAPYRCPPDGTLHSFYAAQYSDAVMEAAEAMKQDIVYWRRQSRD